MRFQTDKIYPEYVRKWGCYLFTLIKMGEIVADKVLTNEQVLNLINIFRIKHWIDAECTILKPDYILSDITEMLNSKIRIVQVGTQLERKEPVFWRWVKGECFDFMALEGITKNNNSHFRLGSHCGVEIYNSYPEVEIIKEKRKILYKLYTM